jgi:hypothetical protein
VVVHGWSQGEMDGGREDLTRKKSLVQSNKSEIIFTTMRDQVPLPREWDLE